MKKILNEDLGRLTVSEYAEAEKLPVVVVVDNVRSMYNIGSIFRTSDAFCVSEVHLCGICAVPPNKEIHKTALGAESSVPWRYFGTTMESVSELRAAGYRVVVVEQVEGAVMLDCLEVDRQGRYALVFGNEVYGVSDDVVGVCDGAIEIPQGGTKHSLNVSVSAGAVLWEFFRQLRIKTL